MYNRYTYPLQPCRHWTLKLFIEVHTQNAKVPHLVDFKSTYISLIIGPKGFACETNQKEIIGWESSDIVRFEPGPLFRGQMRIAKLRSACNTLIIGPRGLQC